MRPPLRGGDLPPPDHSVRLRDGDRAVEVSGSPAFVRQVLDDLPALMARLRGEASPRGGGITMPAPPAEPAPAEAAPVAPAATAPSRPASLEDRILGVLRDSPGPLAIAAIRERLGDASVSGQQVRRLLERANGRVVASGERPATYTLR